MVVMLYGPLRPRCVSAAPRGPDQGCDWGLCDCTTSVVKSYFSMLYNKNAISLKSVKVLKFEAKIVARISSGASLLRKSQALPAGISVL